MIPQLRLQVKAEIELRRRLREQGIERRSSRQRDPEHRRQFAGDPARYIRDILGWTLTPQQEQALDLIEHSTRVLIPSANNLGKTFILAAYGLYVLDALAAVPDEQQKLPEQGAQILLPGPDRATIKSTIYAEILTHAARAETRGHLMPGRRSEASVLWWVRPKWGIEAFSPPAKVRQDVSHTASGRHHRIQVALIEEGQGVRESLWRATEGMCSSEGNKIVSSFNPTEAHGPAYARATDGRYRVMHLDAFDHPNVCRRSLVIEAAISPFLVDDRVRGDCRDRGEHGTVMPDPEHGDFLYALPPMGAEPIATAREDGIPGDPAGAVHIYRPNSMFMAQVRGQYPRSDQQGLFSPSQWDAGVARWKERDDPFRAPDRVGVDCARTGDDDCAFAPAWGSDAETLLRRYAEIQRSVLVEPDEGSDQGLFSQSQLSARERIEQADPEAKLRELQEQHRIRVGAIRIAPKGTGPVVAQYIASFYPHSPWMVDETGVGSSVLDHAQLLGIPAHGVSFGAEPPERLPDEYLCDNTVTALYVRAAMLIRRDLVDIPDDPQLRQEVLCREIKASSRTIDDGQGGRRIAQSVRLTSKDEAKKKLGGRSPDRADAFVLALWQATQKKGVLWSVV